MSVEDFSNECRRQQGPSFEPDGFSEKILYPGLQGIKCPKNVYIFTFSSKRPRIFLIFSIRVEANRAHSYSQMVFLKIFLIRDYRGLSVNFFFFYFFGLFSKTSLRNFIILCVIIDDNRAYCLSQTAFMKKVSPGLKGIKCTIFKVLDFSSKKALSICLILCMVVEGNGEDCLSQTSFLKRF